MADKIKLPAVHLKKVPSDPSLHSGHSSDEEGGDNSGSGKKHSAGKNNNVGQLQKVHSTKSTSSMDSSEFDTETDYSMKSARTESSDGGDDGDRYLPKIRKFFKKQAKAVVRAFVDYGPPYNDSGFDVALINECAKPVLNHFEVHKLLNSRVNPNLPDPDDLYFTPMHWCARNGHYLGIKMLKRAGGEFNVTNEMGLTPLSLAVMMKLPPTRRNDQLKVVKYLLENSANPNVRDKGGYCAVDHAAVNQDIEIIKLLLEFGANVRRENYMLVAQRESVLKHVINPECYRILYEKLLQEENDYWKTQATKNKFQKEVDTDKYYEKLNKELAKKKEKRQLKQKEIKHQIEKESLHIIFTKELEKEEQLKLTKQARSQIELNGTWKKNEISGQWDFTIKEYGKLSRDGIYESNRKIMKSLQSSYNFTENNKKWKQITNHSTGLEIEKPLISKFMFEDEKKEEEDDDNNDKYGKSGSRNSNRNRSNTNSRLRNRNEKDFEFKDSNDEELAGIDLESFLNI
jgi:ankyrin repeat protein